MPELEAVFAVRDFVERGGDVLLVIALVTAVMWMLIYERFWYFRFQHKREVENAKKLWDDWDDHTSWEGRQYRRMLISEVRLKLERGLPLIGTIVVVCPMFGLLGTVTGMIEVFDVMAVAGSGNARGMAAGVSKATLPTMAGMVGALSGMLFHIQLRRFAMSEAERVADTLLVKD
ncbi:MAG: MotA/TolQ/ExbB proton channel family protein [Myxococcota bacterium]